jgi:hypothetical protein
MPEPTKRASTIERAPLNDYQNALRSLTTLASKTGYAQSSLSRDPNKTTEAEKTAIQQIAKESNAILDTIKNHHNHILSSLSSSFSDEQQIQIEIALLAKQVMKLAKFQKNEISYGIDNVIKLFDPKRDANIQMQDFAVSYVKDVQQCFNARFPNPDPEIKNLMAAMRNVDNQLDTFSKNLNTAMLNSMDGPQRTVQKLKANIKLNHETIARTLLTGGNNALVSTDIQQSMIEKAVAEIIKSSAGLQILVDTNLSKLAGQPAHNKTLGTCLQALHASLQALQTQSAKVNTSEASLSSTGPAASQPTTPVSRGKIQGGTSLSAIAEKPELAVLKKLEVGPSQQVSAVAKLTAAPLTRMQRIFSPPPTAGMGMGMGGR